MAFLPFLNVVHTGIKADLPILVVILIGDVPNVTKKVPNLVWLILSFSCMIFD